MMVLKDLLMIKRMSCFKGMFFRYREIFFLVNRLSCFEGMFFRYKEFFFFLVDR